MQSSVGAVIRKSKRMPLSAFILSPVFSRRDHKVAKLSHDKDNPLVSVAGPSRSFRKEFVN